MNGGYEGLGREAVNLLGWQRGGAFVDVMVKDRRTCVVARFVYAKARTALKENK